MCHLSMKLSDTLVKIPLVLLTKLGKNPFQRKTLSWLDLESQGQGPSKNQKQMPWATKNMPPQKNLSRGSLSTHTQGPCVCNIIES